MVEIIVPKHTIELWEELNHDLHKKTHNKHQHKLYERHRENIRDLMKYRTKITPGTNSQLMILKTHQSWSSRKPYGRGSGETTRRIFVFVGTFQMQMFCSYLVPQYLTLCTVISSSNTPCYYLLLEEITVHNVKY